MQFLKQYDELAAWIGIIGLIVCIGVLPPVFKQIVGPGKCQQAPTKFWFAANNLDPDLRDSWRMCETTQEDALSGKLAEAAEDEEW